MQVVSGSPRPLVLARATAQMDHARPLVGDEVCGQRPALQFCGNAVRAGCGPRFARVAGAVTPLSAHG